MEAALTTHPRPTLRLMAEDTDLLPLLLAMLPRATTRRVLAHPSLRTPPLHSQLTPRVATKVQLAPVPMLVAKPLPPLSTRLASTRPC